jgi:hypothetical protein
MPEAIMRRTLRTTMTTMTTTTTMFLFVVEVLVVEVEVEVVAEALLPQGVVETTMTMTMITVCC